MDWIDMDLFNERTGWMLLVAFLGWVQGALSVYWIFLKPAKREHRQLKDKAMVKVRSIGAKLEESEELLDRLSRDYPHLFNGGPASPRRYGPLRYGDPLVPKTTNIHELALLHGCTVTTATGVEDESRS